MVVRIEMLISRHVVLNASVVPLCHPCAQVSRYSVDIVKNDDILKTFLMQHIFCFNREVLVYLEIQCPIRPQVGLRK